MTIPADSPIETATVIDPGERPADWPIIGPETQALLATPQVAALGDSADDIVEEARRILRRNGRLNTVQPRQQVGLVTGYVQSGKTLSFTTVCALARDNGFPLVIVITGISTNLFDQSNRRLERELRLLTRPDRKWLHVSIDTRAPSPTQRIADSLSDWHDETMLDARRQAVLITVMKNHRNLDYLVRALSEVPLNDVPTLIIDDEGDQASLNYLVNRGRESSIYGHIGRLRQSLPRHAYLQYTATPQAPLLINIIDALSPSFVQVLMPGPGYTGGLTFFPPGDRVASGRHVRTIPSNEIFAPGQPLTAPPGTYRLALATFFVGVAAGEIRDGGEGNRSMMVHPHQTRTLHADYFVWAESLKTDWQRALAAPDFDDSKIQVVDLLRTAYNDLATTVSDLPTWEEIITSIPRAIRKTTIWEVNSGRGPTPTIPWRDNYSHILIGGQVMDRGFTVEGLTVTYMPRGVGDANADTIQQRARFFGYKTRYLGYCRVWLEQVVRDAFEDYVEHEENIRKRLIDHDTTGHPLREWKRAFFLDQALRPTRHQVVSVAYSRGNHGERWVDPSRPHELQETIAHNNGLIGRFVGQLSLGDDDGDPRRTVYQRHKVAHGIPLKRVYEDLLEDLRLPDLDDSLQHTALLLQISNWLEQHADARCSVFVMRPGAAESRRTRTPDDRLENFYQGANPSAEGPEQGSIYPGDRNIRHPSDLTIQIHTLDLDPNPKGEDRAVYSRVSIVATHVPADMGKDWVVQR